MIIGLVFSCSKRENKECIQYKHKKQGKNNIFIEFYQMVNKHDCFRGQRGIRVVGKIWRGK